IYRCRSFQNLLNAVLSQGLHPLVARIVRDDVRRLVGNDHLSNVIIWLHQLKDSLAGLITGKSALFTALATVDDSRFTFQIQTQSSKSLRLLQVLHAAFLADDANQSLSEHTDQTRG